MNHPLPASRFVFIFLTLTLLLAVGSLASTAWAQGTPDEATPAQETVCDGLEGKAFGICNAYCEATDCGDGVNYASAKACASLQKNWQKHTGTTEFPCECGDGGVFIPGEGCACGVDLVVTIQELRSLGCPGGQGTCEFEVDVEVANLGTQAVDDPFPVIVELITDPGTQTEIVPAGLAPGGVVEILGIGFGPGDNCYDPDCEVFATVDPVNDIEECDEDNNGDMLLDLG